MSATVAALVGAAIGAVAGLAGGAFAALASIRASQLAARAILAPKLHELSNAIVTLRGTMGLEPEDELRAKKNLERAWNDFAVHQRVLCPSKAIEVLAYILRTAAFEEGYTLQAVATIAGQAQDKVARIVGLYSEHVFRFRARQEEKEVIAAWLAGEARGWLSDGLRKKVAEDLNLSQSQRKRIKPANSN